MFLIGGIDGAFAASPPVDFALQDTYWIVAHIHYVLFGGSVMGLFAGIYYWFPKYTGARLDERFGKIHFTLLFIGANLTFFPMHIVGIEGMPRRIADYPAVSNWPGINLLETTGAFILAFSMLFFLWNVFSTLRGPRTYEPDPWHGNTLEWATTSPPPPYNFDHLPPIRSERPVFDVRVGAVDDPVLAKLIGAPIGTGGVPGEAIATEPAPAGSAQAALPVDATAPMLPSGREAEAHPAGAEPTEGIGPEPGPSGPTEPPTGGESHP
jgi:cytochrome c oxidase subunit 1